MDRGKTPEPVIRQLTTDKNELQQALEHYIKIYQLRRKLAPSITITDTPNNQEAIIEQLILPNPARNPKKQDADFK
jgi:hypothetical protein